MRDGVRLEVTSAYTDGRRAAAALIAAKRASEASQVAYDTSLQLYKVGKATTTELIDAEGELVNSLLTMISAHIDTRLAETRLARATGRDLRTLTAR
jgi:outer membrane protein